MPKENTKRPAPSSPPTDPPADCQALAAEVGPHFQQFLDALGGTPEEIGAARDRFHVALRAASARHGVAEILAMRRTAELAALRAGAPAAAQ